MKTNNKKIIILLAVCFVMSLFLIPAHPAKAADGQIPTACDNLSVGLRSTSELVSNGSGYMRVFYDGKKICIENYDNKFQIKSKKSIAMELPIWGGFYAGSNGYYVIEGQNNTAESDTAEVIRVIKYDKNWNKKGTAKITGNPELFGGEVRYPFDYGCVEATEYNGTLYIVTGHEGYVDPDVGQGHQGFLMIAVNEASMTGQIVSSDLWHSFAQYIDHMGSNLYVLEQSEGSRYTALTKYDAGDLTGTTLPVLKYGGARDSAWAIPCYASVDGMALSADHVLCLGTSIDQSQYNNVTDKTAYNIYLTVTPTSDFSEEATTVKWLTSYKNNGKSFLGSKITKVNDNRFMISWEEYGTEQTAATDDGLSGNILHYVFVNGKGEKISKEFTASAPISDCQPIVKGSGIVYCASSSNMVNFYTIDASTGKFSKTTHRIAGEKAVWNCKNGTLTISGTGAVIVDADSSDENCWAPIRDKVKKIIIKKGITSISENAFVGFDSLKEVTLESGLKSIGKQAFYSCENLSKITIPATVTSIGKDILWTGYYYTYDDSHVTSATIYAPYNSYAIKYAKKNKISYKVLTTSISKAKVSGLKSNYAYTGKTQKPKVTVKLGKKTLKKGTDYTASYSKNKNTGTATVTVKGIKSYSGTIKKTFRIVPKKAVLSKLTSPKAQAVKVTWKKDPQASGYQIQYAANSKFSKGKKALTIKKRTTGSKTITKLKRNKKYYLRVRAYKTIKGKKYYGAWSKSKRVRCS